MDGWMDGLGGGERIFFAISLGWLMLVVVNKEVRYVIYVI